MSDQMRTIRIESMLGLVPPPQSLLSLFPAAATCWAIFLVLGSLLAVCPLASAQSDELRYTPLVRAVQKARPSVVNIHSEKTLTTTDRHVGSIETSRRVNGMGTGVVLDERGYIITNQHVIDGVEKIRVTLADGQVYSARLISYDRDTDLAIIKIDLKNSLPVITVGTSSDLMIGEPVAAMGNAYGYEHTVTRGIISAMHRTVQVSDTQQYEDLIQTDASINPGNSGGPLLNIKGEMIGINVAVRAGAQGIGFAIPVDKALHVGAALLDSEELGRVRHGVKAADLSQQTKSGMVIQQPEEDSPAAECGLQAGDRIVRVNETAITRALDFERALLEIEPEEEVALEVVRDGQTKNLTLTIQPVNSDLEPDLRVWNALGMKLISVASNQFKQQRNRYRGGLLVAAVRDNGPAARQGIRRGDVLVGLHIWETISLDNITHILNRPEIEQIAPVKFYVVRSGKTLFGHLPLELE